MIWYESELAWDDCGLFNCFWALDSYVGQINLDVELYPDIVKFGFMARNYIVYLTFPWIDGWMLGNAV